MLPRGVRSGWKRTFAGIRAKRWKSTQTSDLLNAEFDQFVTPQVSISGRDQAHAPNYTFAMGGVYRHVSGAFARLDFAAKDEFYFDVSHDQKSDPTQC